MLVSLGFGGFIAGDRPIVDMVSHSLDVESDACSLVISLPSLLLDEPKNAEGLFSAAIDDIWQLILQVDSGFAPMDVVFVSVSSACPLAAGFLRYSLLSESSIVLVSACYDRYVTPFGHTYDPEAKVALPADVWFDFRALDLSYLPRCLIVHGCNDLNPSTYFSDAYSFYTNAIACGAEITMLQVSGHYHGYSLLQLAQVSEFVEDWARRR